MAPSGEFLAILRSDEHLEFVRAYLKDRGIHIWETQRNENYMQIHQIQWAAGRGGAVRDATTGRIIGSGAPTLPFEHSDLYDDQGRKHIAPRLSHLPRSQTLAMIQGLIETDGNVSREKEVTFCNTSQPLVEGLRYQLLRMGIPTAGKLRRRKNDHKGKRCDGSEVHFKGETLCYDLRIPATAEIAERVGSKTVTKKNWFIHNNHLFTRIKKQEKIPTVPFVYDLKSRHR